MTIAKNLSASHKVYLIDLRNHGSSFHHNQFDYPVMAEDLTRFVQNTGLNTYSMMGHSLGGKTAMFHAVNNQDRVVKLIVVDIAPGSYPVRHQQILEALSSIDPGTITSRSQADDQLKKYILEPGVRQFLLKNLKRNSNGTFEWKINLPVIRDHIDRVGDALPEHVTVKIPTLFIRGGSSDYITENDLPVIEKQFPESIVKTIPGAGHWVHAEAPRRFMEVVKSYLD